MTVTTTENNSLRDFDPFVRDIDGEIVGIKSEHPFGPPLGVKDISEMPAARPGQGAKI